jgi:hypothetical protein
MIRVISQPNPREIGPFTLFFMIRRLLLMSTFMNSNGGAAIPFRTAVAGGSTGHLGMVSLAKKR